MIDYPASAAVAAVVREGSFERAATSLGITPSAVSQRVRGLEERLGVVLLRRGQPCLPTDTGRALIAHFDRVRLLEADLAPALGVDPAGGEGRAPAPTLRVAVNADSLATWFPAAMAAFGRTGGVTLDVTVDDEGHSAERLRSGEAVAAVTADPAPVQGCRTFPLGALRYRACASPDFVARHLGGVARTAAGRAIAAAPRLRFDRHDRLQDRWFAAAHGSDDEDDPEALPSGPVHRVPSTHAFLDLAVAGLAWGMQPETLAAPHVAAGRLVELPPRRPLDIDLFWIVARLPAAAVTALTAAVRAAARPALVPPGTVDAGAIR